MNHELETFSFRNLGSNENNFYKNVSTFYEFRLDINKYLKETLNGVQNIIPRQVVHMFNV